MSYTRDRDRATRGVGAIASADHSPARQAFRLRTALATRARDRAMAGIARGALGLVTADSGGGGGSVAPTIAFVPGGTYAAITTTADIAPKPPQAYTVATPTPPAGPGAPAPVTSTKKTPLPATSSGGGAMGVGVAMGPAPVSAPIPPIPTLDTGVEDQPPATGATDNTMRNVLIAGGAALAYFLFVRRSS